MDATATFAGLASVLENPHVKAWKENGGRVAGYYCSLVPEEIIHAAGVLPFRIRGTGNADFNKADALLSRFNCTYIRSTLNLFMNGQYGFLDGMVSCNSCDQARRMHDLWGRKLGWKHPLFFLSFPHVLSREGRTWCRDELAAFMERIERKFGASISESSLRDAIVIYEKNASLLAGIRDMLWSDPPLMSGTEALALNVANNSCRKEFANEQLEAALHQIKARGSLPAPRARLMVAGSYVDNPELIKVLEHAGAIVVSLNLCTAKVDDAARVDQKSKEGPLDSLVSKYYEGRTCPRMMNDFSRRLDRVKAHAASARVDGVVLQRIEFCDLHGNENMLLQHALAKEGMPALNLDREYFLGDTGRLRTRVEAFLEKLSR